MKALHLRFFCAAIVIAGLILPGAIAAQSHFTCTGSGCQYLPVSQDKLNRMLTEFQNQYSDRLFDDMAEAATLANISGPPIGSVNLSGFTFGVNASLAGVPPKNVTVRVPGESEVQDIPSAGAAVSPRVFVGANLGQLIGLDYDPFGSQPTPAFYSPSRFDVYLSAMDVSETYQVQGQVGGKVEGSAYFRGVEVRYHLVEGAELGGFLLRFMGVSLGVGMYTSRQNIFFDLDEQQLTMETEGQQLVWEPKVSVNWTTKVDSYPVELRTGLQILYVLRLTAGLGVSMNKGSTEFLLNQYGPVYAKSDLAQSLGYELPSAALYMDIAGNGRVPARMPFAKLGVELNLWALQIGVEAVATRRSYGANVGIRTEI